MNQQNYELNRAHLQDQMREAAESQRQIQQLYQPKSEQSNGALQNLGRQMIKLGEWLQQQ